MTLKDSNVLMSYDSDSEGKEDNVVEVENVNLQSAFKQKIL